MCVCVLCSLIYGFISKDEAKRKLYDSPCGTFLLRFSESNIESSQRSDISGFLTLAVMELDPKTGAVNFCMFLVVVVPHRLHVLHKMRPVATDVARSVVCVFVCVSVALM